MRLALYQSRSPAGDIPAGIAILHSALKGAAQSGVDMLVMPELFLPGYNAVTETPPEGWGVVNETVAGLCRTHGVGLTIGLPEYDGPRVYNSAFAFDATGKELARYRKVQLFGPREKRLFTPGEQHVTFDYLEHRFGLLICYDVEFPEHGRALARAGAQVILCPTANMMPYVNVNLIQVPGRALENGITIVYANYTGTEGDLTYVGYSVIAGPDGYPLGSKGKGEGLVVAEQPTDLLENGIPFSTQLSDYRPAKEP
ncbi:carbon-nitrogen hydrolase family protein [Flavimaricola marinus]|uniref:(R)-stereoselective amidase n=1 Tax=Flavimaricola marinus TaxID=1819565 RepID=A0A238LCS8_9RHOB|nr:carbon-nitrogen hydrolase family protein [Flavimaricola marinus]SMY07527.1 (R)-stereoselective amidase [Flavimaricola marinus]